MGGGGCCAEQNDKHGRLKQFKGEIRRQNQVLQKPHPVFQRVKIFLHA